MARVLLVPVLLCSLSLVACEGEPEIKFGDPNRQVERREAAADKPDEAEALPPAIFQESDFVESERSRNPFRSYAEYFLQEARGEVKSQREVVLEQYAVDELKLVGIVTGIDPPKAMLVNPTGIGHVVQRGQFVGRPTVVQPTSGVGAAYEVNWRIDAIRVGDLVLVRDDPANPDVPSATRVVPLRTDELELVPQGSGNRPAESPADLDRQVEELKQRLEAMEGRKTTVEVVRPDEKPSASSPEGVLRAPQR